jgi:peptidoglycan/xylan/chitin deacetylase (PgdA/CDA1 family)
MVAIYHKTLKRKSVTFLAYHKVNNSEDYLPNTVTINSFIRQIDLISKNYIIITVNEAIDRIINNNIGNNYLAITFDDGYKDNYYNVYKILKQLNIKTTVFLTVNPVIDRNNIFNEPICYVINNTVKYSADLSKYGIGIYNLASNEAKSKAGYDIVRKMIPFDKKLRDEIIDYLSIILEVKVPENIVSETILNKDEIEEMYRNGFTFGAHTLSHPDLKDLDEAMAWEEIDKSKAKLAAYLGMPIEYFAYPFGSYNDNTVKMVEKAAYKAAFVLDKKGENHANVDLFKIKRLCIHENMCASFGGRFSPAIFMSEVTGLLRKFIKQ